MDKKNRKNRKSEKEGKSRQMWMFIIGTAVCFVILVCIILPPSLGKVRPYPDENGEILEESISEKIFLDINNTSLGMFITAKDKDKPVLLFLGGGPGLPEYLMEQWYPSGLDDEFVVCWPEYRGASLSYDPQADPESLTLEQYMEDAVEITHYLRERFGQEKIYLMAHSFGTYVGINLAERHPELYHSYIAMAQIVDSRKSEALCYDYMLEQYKEQGNAKRVKQFEQYPIHTSEEAFDRYLFASGGIRDKAMHELGVGTMRDMRSVITGIFFPSLRTTVYTPGERINIWRGKSFVIPTPVNQGVFSFNAYKDIQEISIPIYFLGGIYDYNVSYVLQKEYYEFLKAPQKAFYTFEDSAHSPLFEEPEKAMEILARDVINGKKELADR